MGSEKFREKFEKKHSNAFLESGCRCHICDSFGTKDVPVTFPFICQKCKNKKETTLLLEKERIEGLISHYTLRVDETWKSFKSNSDSLSFQINKLEETKQKLKRS